MQSIQQQPVAFVQPVQQSTYPKYNHRFSLFVGITLIIVGTLSFVFGIVNCAVGAELSEEITRFNNRLNTYGYNSYTNRYDRYGNRIQSTSYRTYYGVPSLYFVGHGIWSGIIFIIAGCFGVGAKSKRKCPVVTFLVFCILTMVFAGFLLAVGATGTGLASNHPLYDDCKIAKELSNDVQICNKMETVLAMEILLMIMGILAFAASLWGSIICCMGGGCCCCGCCQTTTSYPSSGTPMVVIGQQPQQVPVAYYAPGTGAAYVYPQPVAGPGAVIPTTAVVQPVPQAVHFPPPYPATAQPMNMPPTNPGVQNYPAVQAAAGQPQQPANESGKY